MSRWIRWFKDNGTIYPEVGQMPLANLEGTLKEFGAEARKVLKETRADHVIYATKEYDEQDEVKEVHFYMLPLTDEEFHKRVANFQKTTPKSMIYAAHKL